MGFDISGLNPKMNKDRDSFPMLSKWDGVAWPERDRDKKWSKEQDKYWKEENEFRKINCGDYFRNNVWWWKPLWNYCYKVCDDLLTKEEWESGTYNDGHEYSEKKCLEMAELLQEQIDKGYCMKYEVEYKTWQLNLPKEPCYTCNGNNRGHKKKKDCKGCEGTGERDNWSASYPFDVENVQRFVNFLKECGGMSIC